MEDGNQTQSQRPTRTLAPLDRDPKRPKGGHAMDTEEHSLAIISPLVLTTSSGPMKSVLRTPSVHTRKATPAPLQLYIFDVETSVTPKAKAKFESNFGLEPMDPSETDPTMTIQTKPQEVYSTLTDKDLIRAQQKTDR